MSKVHDSHVCTCPSGDGSLRWPCPVHPALHPCPFCGASAAVQNESPADNSGGYFVECKSCGASTNLRYACGDDPLPLLVAQWNARAPLKTAEGAYPALPKPAYPAQFNGHGGEQSSSEGYSAEQMRAYAAQAVEAEGARPAVAVPEFDEWISREYPHLGPIGDGVNIALESWNAGRTALAATQEIPATEVSSAGYLAEPMHRDDAAVDSLAAKMKAKLANQRSKGYGGWDTPVCSQQRLSAMLREHVAKGDPVDVANFCSFLAARGEGIEAEVQAEPVAYVLGDPRYADSSNVFMSHQFTPDGEHEHEWKPLYTAPQAQPADVLAPIRQTVRDYHYALDTRQHGDVAANTAIRSIERALCTPWIQGEEKARRSVIPAISQLEQDE